MKTRTTCLLGIFALSVFSAGTAFAGKTCEEQEAKEAERLATAAGKCEQKLLDKGCDASACQVTAECVPNPLASSGYVVDSGSGTVIDLRTCLEWEKKCDGCGELHAPFYFYSWACRDGITGADEELCQATQEASDACFAGATIYPAGPEEARTVGCRLCDTNSPVFFCAGTTRETIWEWLVAVNAEGLGGHDDWRIPDKRELESLLAEPYPCGTVGPPCVDPAIGPTAPLAYRSSTTDAGSPSDAWGVSFLDGLRFNSAKTTDITGFVRAVRSGL